jgi:hypothetical protein
MTNKNEARQKQIDFSPAELNHLTENLRQHALRIPGAARLGGKREAGEPGRDPATRPTEGKPGA